MDLPELSLAPSSCRLTLECNSSSESSDTGSSKKRKAFSEGILENKWLRSRQSIDLQHSDERLPLDWEQCLDLKSGKMYFLNRKTQKKSWERPTIVTNHHHNYHRHGQQLDLELNISSPTRSATTITNKPDLNRSKKSELLGVTAAQALRNNRKDDDDHRRHSTLATSNSNPKDQLINNNNNNNSNMVAMACTNCHLLVILSKSTPTCPNCKFIHSIPPAQQQQLSTSPKNPNFKPLNTLSLFS